MYRRTIPSRPNIAVGKSCLPLRLQYFQIGYSDLQYFFMTPPPNHKEMCLDGQRWEQYDVLFIQQNKAWNAEPKVFVFQIFESEIVTYRSPCHSLCFKFTSHLAHAVVCSELLSATFESTVALLPVFSHGIIELPSISTSVAGF